MPTPNPTPAPTPSVTPAHGFSCSPYVHMHRNSVVYFVSCLWICGSCIATNNCEVICIIAVRLTAPLEFTLAQLEMTHKQMKHDHNMYSNFAFCHITCSDIYV